MKKEINKKVLLLLLVLFSVVLINLFTVSAETNADVAIRTVATWWANTSGINAANSTPWLLGALLWIVLYSVLVKTGILQASQGSMGIGAAVVALIVTILAFITLPPQFWTDIALQYSALGATILTLVPFLIMFYFTMAVSESSLLSRFFWVVYVIYYFVVFVYKIAMSEVSWLDQSNWPYLIAIVAGILALIALPIIRRWYWKEEILSEKEKMDRKIDRAALGINEAGKIVTKVTARE